MSSTGTPFSRLRLRPEIVSSLSSMGITHASPIQEHAIPLARMGLDIILQGKSGTGKTIVAASSVGDMLGMPVPWRRAFAKQIETTPSKHNNCGEGARSKRNIGNDLNNSHGSKKNSSRSLSMGIAAPAFCDRNDSSNANVEKLDVAQSVLMEDIPPQVVVVCPTREIADQFSAVVTCVVGNLIHRWQGDLERRLLRGASTESMAAFAPVRVSSSFVGGTSLDRDSVVARRTFVAVGTPGRLIHLIRGGLMDVSNVRTFVIDEADRLAEPGSFEPQLRELHALLPRNKQIIAMSATFTATTLNIVRSLTAPSPAEVLLSSRDPSLHHIGHFFEPLPPGDVSHRARWAALTQVLSRVPFHQCIAFVSSRARASKLRDALEAEGYPAAHITSDQTQRKRREAIREARSFAARVLVSTDVAARGIDLERVDLVVNMDMPPDAETYLHRTGRAGRYGSRGIAVNIVAVPGSAAIDHRRPGVADSDDVVHLAINGERNRYSCCDDDDVNNNGEKHETYSKLALRSSDIRFLNRVVDVFPAITIRKLPQVLRPSDFDISGDAVEDGDNYQIQQTKALKDHEELREHDKCTAAASSSTLGNKSIKGNDKSNNYNDGDNARAREKMGDVKNVDTNCSALVDVIADADDIDTDIDGDDEYSCSCPYYYSDYSYYSEDEQNI